MCDIQIILTTLPGVVEDFPLPFRSQFSIGIRFTPSSPYCVLCFGFILKNLFNIACPSPIIFCAFLLLFYFYDYCWEKTKVAIKLFSTELGETINRHIMYVYLLWYDSQSQYHWSKRALKV